MAMADGDGVMEMEVEMEVGVEMEMEMETGTIDIRVCCDPVLLNSFCLLMESCPIETTKDHNHFALILASSMNRQSSNPTKNIS